MLVNSLMYILCCVSEAVGSYAENQRITAVRRVYQRGCVNPMINIEQLWRDYSKYEEVRDPPRTLYVCIYVVLVVQAPRCKGLLD